MQLHKHTHTLVFFPPQSRTATQLIGCQTKTCWSAHIVSVGYDSLSSCRNKKTCTLLCVVPRLTGNTFHNNQKSGKVVVITALEYSATGWCYLRVCSLTTTELLTVASWISSCLHRAHLLVIFIFFSNGYRVPSFFVFQRHASPPKKPKLTSSHVWLP